VQSIYSFVLVWLVALVGLLILMSLKNVEGSQEEESEDEAADEPVMPDYDHYLVSAGSSNHTLDQRVESIKADGRCHYLNSGITGEHFPGQQIGVSGKVKIILVPLKNKEVKELGLFEYMNKFGLRPGRIDEVIDLSQVYPEIHRKTVLIAFGSVWEQSSEHRLVPYFEFNGAMYGMYLGKDKDILANKSDDDCFAIAVSKRS